MTSRRRKHKERILLERKVWSLGKFHALTMSDSTLSKLRSHLRLTRGNKTRLRLSIDGLACGYRTGSVFTNRQPAEFISIRDIHDMFVDPKYTSTLFCVLKHPVGHYEIQAFRFQEESEARLLRTLTRTWLAELMPMEYRLLH